MSSSHPGGNPGNPKYAEGGVDDVVDDSLESEAERLFLEYGDAA